MKHSIVLLCYNGYQYTHQLLMDIKSNCIGVHEVVVINNGSEDPAVATGLEFWKSLNVLPLTIYTISKNKGFIYGINYGITKATTGDVVTAISNDVRIVSKSYLSEIDKALEENPKRLIGPTLYTQSTGWNVFQTMTVPYVEGYCVTATREFWNKHKFDDLYYPADFEDVDLSMQAVHDGYELYQLKANIVQHLGGKTYGYSDERAARTTRNKAAFAKKWGL